MFFSLRGYLGFRAGGLCLLSWVSFYSVFQGFSVFHQGGFLVDSGSSQHPSLVSNEAGAGAQTSAVTRGERLLQRSPSSASSWNSLTAWQRLRPKLERTVAAGKGLSKLHPGPPTTRLPWCRKPRCRRLPASPPPPTRWIPCLHRNCSKLLPRLSSLQLPQFGLPLESARALLSRLRSSLGLLPGKLQLTLYRTKTHGNPQERHLRRRPSTTASIARECQLLLEKTCLLCLAAMVLAAKVFLLPLWVARAVLQLAKMVEKAVTTARALGPRALQGLRLRSYFRNTNRDRSRHLWNRSSKCKGRCKKRLRYSSVNSTSASKLSFSHNKLRSTNSKPPKFRCCRKSETFAPTSSTSRVTSCKLNQHLCLTGARPRKTGRVGHCTRSDSV